MAQRQQPPDAAWVEGEDDEDMPPYDNDDDESSPLNDYYNDDEEEEEEGESLNTPKANGKQRITIIGTGWAGYTLATSLDTRKFAITIISPSPNLVYTPLLARVATAQLAPHLAEAPIRGQKRGIRYLQATVLAIDFAARRLRCKTASDWPRRHREDNDDNDDDDDDGDDANLFFSEPFDRLAVAPGCAPHLFGVPGAARHAQFVRTAADARALRRRLVAQLERASVPGLTPQQQRDRLRVVVVGGAPPGVELAAALGDLSRSSSGGGHLRRLYPGVADKLSVVVASPQQQEQQALSAYDRKLHEYAREQLLGGGGGGGGGRRDIEVRASARVERVEHDAVYTREEGRLPCGLLVWATGNTNVALIERLDARKCSSGDLVRLLTDSRLRVYKPKSTTTTTTTDGDRQSQSDGGGGDDDDDDQVWEGIYGLGDACDIEGQPLPTTAEVAVQKARYLACVLNSGSETPFRFRPKGLATYIGGGGGSGSHDGIIQDSEWTGKAAWLAWRQGSLAWTRSLRARSMILLNWGFNRLFGSELARL